MAGSGAPFRGDARYREYPKLSIEDWHRKRGLWIE
jgi:hypothetical protein